MSKSGIRKKVTLLIIEGLGASTKRDLTPFLPSNTNHIDEIFSGYEKKILKTSDDSIDNIHLENDISSLCNTLASSRRTLSPEISFSKDKNQLKEKLKKSLHNCKNHASSLHLFTILSNNKKIFNHEIYDEIIEGIKKHGINKVYLHLICDFGVKSNKISEFINNFNQIDGKKFQVSTVSGISNLTSGKTRDVLEVYKASTFGKNRQILDISNIDDGDYAHLLPHTFVKNKKPIGMISDFDTVLFPNINNELTLDLIYLLNKKTKSFSKDRNFFQLNIVTLTDIYKKISNKKISYLISSATSKKNIFSLISEYGFKQLKIFDSSDREIILEGYNGSSEIMENEELALVDNDDNYIENTSYIMQSTIKAIKKDDHDLIFASLNGLRKTAYLIDLKQAIGVVDKINLHIDDLVNNCLKNNTTLIITSPFAGSDRFPKSQFPGQQTNFDNVKLENTPFVIINKEHKKEINNQFIINKSNLIDIISSKSSILDVAPTILDLLNIDKPENFKGRSLINVK